MARSLFLPVASVFFALTVGFIAVPGSAKADGEGHAVPASELSICYETCEYHKGRADEACARKRNSKAKALCFAKAMNVYATCRVECEKRFKGGGCQWSEN